MSEILLYVLAVIGGAALGAVGSETVKWFFERLKTEGFVLRSAAPNLAGVWFAAWETTVNHRRNINTEEVVIRQRGRQIKIHNKTVSAENTKGGYLWRLKGELCDGQYLLGTYKATDRNLASKGVLFFNVNRHGIFMAGKWVGCNYESPLVWGFGVLAKSRDAALEKLDAMRKSRGRHKV